MSLTVLFLVPFIGTLLGSAAVYFFHKGIGIRTGKVITGFAGGVMIAASVWSLLLPAIDESSYYTAAAGFLLGIAFLLLLDTVVPHIHATAEKAEGKASGLSRSSLLMLAVTLHNIPEGMAVGAAAAASIAADGGIPYTSALALSLGIALQNFPEGLIVSMPLYRAGKNKGRAFLEGTLSGIVEPIGAVIAFIFVSMLQKEIIGVFAAVPDDAEAQYKNTSDAIIDEITTENTASESSASTSSQSTQPQQTQPQQQATPQQSTESTQTISQKNALKKAGQYLDYSHFSHSGLVGQLEFEGFSTEDATWAADNCGADWNAQAAGKAQDYLDYSAFSRQGLIDQLLFEGFTQEQAEFGVNAVGL